MEGSLVTINPADIGLLFPAVVTLCLLFISGLVSGAEISFFSLTPHDLQNIKAHPERPSNSAILNLLSNVDQLLATILVVNNLVNICIVLLAAKIINTLFSFGSAGMQFLFESVIATFLLLLFGEIIPKVFAQSRPLRFARWVARIILLFRRLVRPVSYVLIRTGSSISEHAVRKSEISLDELADAVDMTSTTSAEEHNMLSGIVKFANTEVQEIMRPRMDVVAVAVGESYESVRGRIIESGFSRIPVYEEDLDNIRGILYVKDLLPYINNGDEFDWRQLLRKAYFVPEHKKINDLLEEFQSNKVHMAVVVDEYGSTLGIVSLEDILEEIVGEISDESDTVETFYTKLDEWNYLFDGKTHIGDFERVLQLPEETFSDCKGKAETLAGLMLEIHRNFLQQGESVTAHDIRFTVHTLDGHRIEKIEVTLPEQ